jgi:GT2 family glycosyltransferase
MNLMWIAKEHAKASAPPSVTIGIPTFNRPDTLRTALESATSQDYASLKIVVSDNASDHATKEVVDKFASRDHRVSYVRHPENIGANANFLSLLDAADTDYFMWLGDDDALGEAGYITSLVETFTDDPTAKMAFPDVDAFFDEGRQSWSRKIMSVHFSGCRTDEDYLRAWCKFGGGHVFYGLYRTDFLRSLEPSRAFDPKIAYYNEGVFLHGAFLAGGLRFTPSATLIYNGLNSSAKATSRSMLAGFLRYSAQTHALYLRSHLSPQAKFDTLRAIAGSHYPYIRALAGKALRNETGG